MNRMTMAAVTIALAGCANFDQLEDDALDAGRVAGMSGGSAGGMSGGGTSGGSAGGSGGGSAGGTSGGSAGGMGGGSSGGMSGGSAGGTSGGSAGGMSGGSAGGMSGGSAGGMSGGSAGGTSGGSAGGSAGGTSGPARGVAAWTGSLEYETTRQLAGIAATSNGPLAFAEQSGGNVTASATGFNPVSTAGDFVDLDARFGFAVVTTTTGVWVLPPQAVWRPVGSGPPMGTNKAFSTPIYRAPSGTEQIASYWQSTMTNEVGVFSAIAASSLSYGAESPLAFQASTLRVRPDENGASGLMVGSRSGPDAGPISFLRRIPSSGGLTDGGDVPSVSNLMVATTESQQALLVWRSVPMGGRIGASFWRPNGSNTIPALPEFRLDSTAGVPEILAVATEGTRFAVVIGPTAASEWAFDGGPNFTGDAGVLINANEYVLVTVGGLAPPRFVTLGPAARPPFGLAFAVRNSDAGIFVMGNCAGVAGFCRDAGAVIGFLPQP